jgi:hypothetical protein
LIIHQPKLVRVNDEIEISSRIEFSQTIENVPERLWFRFPERCEKYITDRGDGFLMCMLIPAMYYGEDIQVRAEVSPKLLYNLKEYQYLYTSTYPLTHVDIRCESMKAFEPEIPPEAVLFTYSGGVDSTYALWSHLPQNQPVTSMRVTHGLLLQGFNDFDIPLENPAYFDFVHKKFTRLFESLDLSLLYAKTNIHRFGKFRIDWDMAHSAILAGIVHLLAGLVKTYIKPDDGGYHHRHVQYIGGESVHLLSTETLETIYFSRIPGREEKLKALAGWEPAHTHLRVCLNWQKQPDQLNCSWCRKCLLNMIFLELIGEYKKFTVFKQPFPRLAVVRWWMLIKSSPLSFKSFRILARENKRYGILLTLWLLAVPRRIKAWVYGQLDRRLTDEVKYKIRARVYDIPHGKGARSTSNVDKE